MGSFTIEAREVEIRPSGFKVVDLTFTADVQDLIERLDESDMAQFSDKGALLDALGVDFCKAHFGLTEESDEA